MRAPAVLFTWLAGGRPRVRYLRLLALAGVVLVVVLAALFGQRLPLVHTLSYPGIFLLSFLGSVSIVVPLPGIVSVCAGGALLTLPPVLVGLVAGLGETLGELSGYLIGFSGRGLVEDRPLYGRLIAWMRRRGPLLLFLVSAIPNPVFDLVGMAAGVLRFPLPWFMGIVFVGKVMKGTYIAYACYLGLEWLVRLVGGGRF